MGGSALRYLLLSLPLALTACGREVIVAPSEAEVQSELQAVYLEGLDSFDLALASLGRLPPRPDAAEAQARFRRARLAYKRIEALVEYAHPLWAVELNAPPLVIPDEDDYEAVLEPQGLQVLEAVTFPVPGPEFAPVRDGQVVHMRKAVALMREDTTQRFRARRAAFDAARMALARIATLGLAGFDATVSRDGILEAAAGLAGMARALGVYEEAMRRRDPDGWREVTRALQDGVRELERSPDFDRFDRFHFLVRHHKPIAEGLARLERALRFPPPALPSPWAPGATNIYAAGAVDAGWFAPDYAPPPSPALVALGRDLFFDRKLSATGRRSCATCHQPALAFTDGRRLAEVGPGTGPVRNTPTLLNAGLQRRLFADQRVMFLEFQFEDVMANPREMDLPHHTAAEKLAADTGLVARFAAATGHSPREALTGRTLSIAVAAYVRSLQGLDSRFDRAVAGDTAALSPAERRGFNLFMGRAACATCHFPPLFSGNMPPRYADPEPEVIGVPATAVTENARVDGDPGVFAVTLAPLHRHAFKTTTVRNVARTAPYMHNGVFRTLEEVVEFYDRGGGNGIGMRLPNQTLAADPLELSDEEKADLLSFMCALTDSAHLTPAASAEPSLEAAECPRRDSNSHGVAPGGF